MERLLSRKLVLGTALCGVLAIPATTGVTEVVGWLNDEQPAGHSLATGTMQCNRWIDMI
jgi:hypothetical protein